MPNADPSLSVAERVDAACDRFESEWKNGGRPRIDDYVGAAPESDRDELRQALLALEVELQGRSEADTSVTRSSVREDGKSTPTMTVDHVQNPRVEAEEHYYNPTHTKLLELGLQPRFLSETLIETMLHAVERYKDRVIESVISPSTKWR